MPNIKGGVSMLFAAFAMAGCSLPPKTHYIEPLAVPSSNYEGLSCDETRALLAQKIKTRDLLADYVNTQSRNSEIGGIIGALIVHATTKNKDDEYARTKGEVIALEGAVPSNCKRN